MNEREFTVSNFMLKDYIEIICILERVEKYHLHKINRKRNYFTLTIKFPTKNGEPTSLKNNASSRQKVSHQDKKEVSSKEKLLHTKIRVKRTNLFISCFWI